MVLGPRDQIFALDIPVTGRRRRAGMSSDRINISAAAAASGLSAKTIRFYEDIGLIVPAQRDVNGYRLFGRRELEELSLVQRARSLGFTLDEIGTLLDLWRDPKRASADVKAMGDDQVAKIDQKMTELPSLRRALADLVERCRGDERPDCPIIDELTGR